MDGGEDIVSMESLVPEAWGADNRGHTDKQSLRVCVGRTAASLFNHIKSVDVYCGALNNSFSKPARIQGNIPIDSGILG